MHPGSSAELPQCGRGYRRGGARVALGAVYGKPVEYYGPTYKTHRIDGEKIVVSFDHVGRGRAFKGGNTLQGFALAGSDGVGGVASPRQCVGAERLV